MLYITMLLLGLIGGGFSVFLLTAERQRRTNEQKTAIKQAAEVIIARQQEVKQRLAKLREAEGKAEIREKELAAQFVSYKNLELAKLREAEGKAEIREKELAAQFVSYKNLQDENAILKRDLQNIDVNLRKLELDRDRQSHEQETLDQRVKELGTRYLKDSVKWVGSSLTANNFVTCKQRLQEVIQRCRGIGLEVPVQEETSLLDDLKAEFEKMVRAEFAREEQARIKARIRDEEKLQREIDHELEQLERERAAIKVALEKALAEAKDQHSEEVERLKARLAEAEEKAQRTKSCAEMTKSGYIYVVSNVGSFGEGMFKIGMTRRLEPLDRVRELGDASVPFPFDVHMMISSEDAPGLENQIHRTLHKRRVNKIKPRKEFYKTDIETLHQIVLDHHGEVEYVATPEALEYRESLGVSDEDAEYIERVYDAVDEEEDRGVDDS